MNQILLVEDDPNCRYIAQYLLQKKGYNVIIDTTGNAVQQIIRDHDISLVVLDVTLPGNNGLDICEDIKAYADIPIILFSARFEHELKNAKCKADAVIPKPFDIHFFEETIEAVLLKQV